MNPVTVHGFEFQYTGLRWDSRAMHDVHHYVCSYIHGELTNHGPRHRRHSRAGHDGRVPGAGREARAAGRGAQRDLGEDAYHRMNQLALDLEPRNGRPTGPSDWLLSFVETRREMRPGLDVWGYHIVRHAAAAASVGENTGLVQAALRELESRGALTRVRYLEHMPQPALIGGSAIWHNNAQTGPLWQWVYRVAPDWRERMGLPPSSYWKIRRHGITYSGQGPVPAYLQNGERLL